MFNMAYHDKGRRKWGGISQENTSDFKSDRTSMRAGANRTPPQALYSPGSGPLRKSGRHDDHDQDSNLSERSRVPSVQDRLKQQNYNNPNHMQNSSRSSQLDKVSDKLNNMHITSRNRSNNDQGVSKNNHSSSVESRRKAKKPEMQIYMPKKVKEAYADQEVMNRMPVQENWDCDRSENSDWETSSNRHRNDSFRSNCSSSHGNHIDDRVRHKDDHPRRQNYSSKDNLSNHQGYNEDRGKRQSYSSNRRNRNISDEDNRSWRPEIKRNSENRRDYSRETRQGSEPLFITPRITNDINHSRDTRSVEPCGYPDQFKGKPPSGKRFNMKDSSKNRNIDSLPPRFRDKYLKECGHLQRKTQSTEDWDGSTVTFETVQHLQNVQNLPPSGPPQPLLSNWSNTIPARSQGRGRARPIENSVSPMVFRPATPDQYSAPSSRSHTPSQEYMNRFYDRRDSNSTMYTSMESLSRDSLLMPPPPTSPKAFQPNRCQSPANNRRRDSTPVNYRQGGHQKYKSHDAPNDPSVEEEKQKNVQPVNVSPPKSETFSPLPDDTSDLTLDWYEEVELSERLEAERLSRSSSVMSLRDNPTVPNVPPVVGSTSSRKSGKKSKRRKGAGDRSRTRDKIHEGSQERQNNVQNRENDNYNNNQKGSIRRFESRRRNTIHRSRESSKERNYGRGPDEFFRTRSHTSDTENWRTGQRTSICDSDDGRRTPLSSHSSGLVNSCPSSVHRQPSPLDYPNCQQPGVLVLPEQNQTSTNVNPLRLDTQQPRTLFDPNNPNKPILVTSPRSRGGAQLSSSQLPCSLYQGPQASGLQNQQADTQIGDEFSNVRTLSSTGRSASYSLMDLGRLEVEMDRILKFDSVVKQWEVIGVIRSHLQQVLLVCLETELKICEKENVEQLFWKTVYHGVIEVLRKTLPKDDPEGRENYKKMMLSLIEDGTVYFEKVLTVLETTYNVKLDNSSATPKGLASLALISAQKIFVFLGDLARYKEQVNETTNYGKSRQWYMKAQQINPKNGKPYNQLAVLAHCARRKLDAVYFYMRSLMASNPPFHSARESLISLFDDNRKKYESTERKRKEERELKERARMKEKEGVNNTIGGGLRREIWVHPGGKRVHRTTTAATSTESRTPNSDLEELAQLTSVEVNKRFITSYLHVHGKLITKIGMETFQEAAIQMLREFRTLLQHSPLPLPGTRLLQLLALNMFAIDMTQLKDSQMEQGYRSEVQERALVVSLQMFSLILERGVSLLKAQLESSEDNRLVVGDDMQVLLPAIKIWCDWMLCHSTVWNPPPSCADYRVGPPGDAWSRLATLVNQLEKLKYPRNLLLQAKDIERRPDDVELVKLPEDTTLSGFTPLMSYPQEPLYADKTEDKEVVQVCLRIHKVLFFGQVFLCGLETPVLKLQKSETGINEYVSVVEASSASTPSSPPEQSDSELMVESYSEDEDEKVSPKTRLSTSGDAADETSTITPPGEIRLLIERKEELERRQRKQDRHRQRIQNILQNSQVSVEIEVRPKQLVPDTNCFIDYLPQLQSIAKATDKAQPIYTLMVPLVVLNELEGLARGADARDCPPASRAALDPDHVARVAENAKIALTFARSRNPAIRCLTTRGTVLTSSTFTMEEDVNQDGLTRNDDRILATCLSLCKLSNAEQTATEGQPRRLRREVVLLTDDRNLRVKALARDVPVREVPDFIQWADLG